MANIPHFSNLNIGSVILIEYLFHHQVGTFNPINRYKISAGNIGPVFGVHWETIYCTQNTMGLQQDLTIDNNLEKWTLQVVGFTPGDEPAIEAGLQDLLGNRFVLRVTLPNGTKKIVGTPDQPLTCGIKSDTQTDYTGRPGTAFTFSGSCKTRALFLVQ